MGKILAPYERQALSSLLDKMMGFQFGDDITYNRARLHTQKNKISNRGDYNERRRCKSF